MAGFPTLSDDFNDNSFDVAKWSKTAESGGALITEQNARLEYYLPATDSYAVVDSVNLYSLTLNTDYAFVQPSYYTTLTQVYAYFMLYNASEYLYWRILDGQLSAASVLNGLSDFSPAVAYNPTAHKWLRYVYDTNFTRVRWQTSADCNTWTNFHSRVYGTPGDMFAQLQVIAGTLSSPQTFAFDNFNKQVVTASIELTGDGFSTNTPVPNVTFHISQTVDGGVDITARGTSLADQSRIDKTYLYKVYDPNDLFLGIWNDVQSDLMFDQELYSAGSSVQVDLARNSDSKVIELEELFTTQTPEVITTQDGNNLILGAETTNSIGPGSNVDVNYRVEIWVFYGEITDLSTTSGEIILTQDGENIQVNFGAVNGQRKFNGYITRYTSRYGGNETVRVSLASFGAELDNYVLESGTATTVTYNSTDPSNILKDALDKFTAAGGLVDYTASSVALTATSVSYTFRLNTYLEVLKKCVELAPYDWYWYVGLGDDTVYFAAKPATASHTFILGKHIQELDVEYSIEEITNKVYFTGGEVSADTNLFKKYTDATSITNYRQGLKRISDHRVTLDASATLIAEAEIDRNAVPRYRSTITILDNVYNIEEIVLGQLVTFRNFGNYIDDLDLQIVGLSYEPDRVTLQLDTLLPSVNKRIEDLRRNLVELDNEQTPSTPT